MEAHSVLALPGHPVRAGPDSDSGWITTIIQVVDHSVARPHQPTWLVSSGFESRCGYQIRVTQGYLDKSSNPIMDSDDPGVPPGESDHWATVTGLKPQPWLRHCRASLTRLGLGTLWYTLVTVTSSATRNDFDSWRRHWLQLDVPSLT